VLVSFDAIQILPPTYSFGWDKDMHFDFIRRFTLASADYGLNRRLETVLFVQ